MQPETTRKQRRILRKISRSPQLVKKPIQPDEKYLRDCGLIRYRGRKNAHEPECGWYITDQGTEYLRKTRIESASKAADWAKWVVGIAIGLAAVLVTIYFGLLDHPEAMQPDTNDNAIQHNIDTYDIEPGGVAVTEEPGAKDEINGAVPYTPDGAADLPEKQTEPPRPISDDAE